MIEKAGGETAFFEDFRTASESFISPILDSFTKIMDAEELEKFVEQNIEKLKKEGKISIGL